MIRRAGGRILRRVWRWPIGLLGGVLCREIIQLLAEGKSNKEIAVVLGISVRTAEAHRANIKHKLGFGSLSDLVRYAIRNKITIS